MNPGSREEQDPMTKHPTHETLWRVTATRRAVLQSLAVLTVNLSATPGFAWPTGNRFAIQGDEAPRLTTQSGHVGGTNAARLSPDGKWLITAGVDGTACLWDVATGREVRRFPGHPEGVVSAVFSPDSRTVLVGGYESAAKIWDIETGKLIRQFQANTTGLETADFSADGNLVLTAGIDKVVRCWNVATGKEVQRFLGHTDRVATAQFSPDGKSVLTASWDKTARIWDATTGKELQRLIGHSEWVVAAVYAPDGKRIATAGWDQTARVWDAATGKGICKFQHNKDVNSVVFSPDGTQVATATDSEVAIWDMEAREGRPIPINAHFAPVGRSTAFWMADGHLVVAEGRGTIRLFAARTGKEERRFEAHTSLASMAAVSRNGRYLVTAHKDGIARIWNLAGGKEPRSLRGHKDAVVAVDISPDSKTALTVDRYGIIRLWELETGKQVRSLESSNIDAAVFSPSGRQIAIASGRTVQILDSTTGATIKELPGHTSTINSVSFSPNGKLIATASSDKTARIWDIATGKEVKRLQVDSILVFSVAFSPDNKSIVTGGFDGTARIWDVVTGKELRRLKGHDQPVRAAVFSPSGKRILTGSYDKTAVVWDVATGREVMRLRGHTSLLTSASYFWDGRYMVTVGMDSTIRLWDTRSGAALCSLTAFDDKTWAASDPVGRFDASRGGKVDGLHWVLGVEPIALEQLAERYYSPNLLAKKLGYDRAPLKDVGAFDPAEELPPVVTVTPEGGNTGTRYTVNLTPRSGGLGKVRVYVNGVLFQEIDRGEQGSEPQTFTVDIADATTRRADGHNEVRVVALNRANWFASRGVQADVQADTTPPVNRRLFALVVGTSRFGNPALDLRFPAKDAQAFGDALERAGKNLFNIRGAERTTVIQLTSDNKDPARVPTKKNLLAAFEEIRQRKPTADDVLVVYLAGHGIALPTNNGLYCYLTAEATSADRERLAADTALRTQTTLTSEEMAEQLNTIGATYRVMMLDTCAAGAAARTFADKRDINDDQVLALERFKGRSGFHVLMGCAADKVSYEASRYQQGILTYALLQGMAGAALKDGKYVDVQTLFAYAQERVELLARGIGGVQQPRYQKPDVGSFDIGLMNEADRKAVRLGQSVPLLVRPNPVTDRSAPDADDTLGLRPLLEKSFATTFSPTTRGEAGTKGSSAAAYIDADSLPDAVRPLVQYTRAKGIVTATITLKSGTKTLSTFTVTHKENDLVGLVKGITDGVAARLSALR